MQPRHPVITALSLLVLGLAASPQRQRGLASVSGPAGGIWELPEFGEGFVIGSLDAVSGAPSLYALDARLVSWDFLMCPACIAGTLEGTLDDGIGPGPDFTVSGGYAGDLLDGSGWFQASLRAPDGTRVGRISGRFGDPPGAGSPGSFAGRWKIRG